MFGKKKIEAVSVLDLRNYTPQALRKISSIQAVSTILLPENPSPAFAEAYADITKGAIAQEVFAPMDKVAQYNGMNVLGSTLPEGAICLCNGMTIFRRAAGEKHARVFLSGIGVAEQGTGLVEANKSMIKEAVERMFEGTKVASVNTMNMDGKKKRRGMVVGKTAKTKKAIVKLTEDSKDIEIFAGL